MTLEAEGGSETYGFSAAPPLPLAIDLYCGLGGWTDGLLAEGYTVVGFDIEAHDYGDGKRYPAQLVLQDVLTLHGAQFAGAGLIVASPPCQEFSYRAMPWKRAKALPPPYLGMQLFWACFRIQAEACEAAGRYIPLVVENVVGAQRWVGDAKAHFGSYYLWGDVGRVGNAVVSSVPKFGQVVRAQGSQKNTGGSWFAVAHNKGSGHSRNPVTEPDRYRAAIKAVPVLPILRRPAKYHRGGEMRPRKAIASPVDGLRTTPTPMGRHRAPSRGPAQRARRVKPHPPKSPASHFHWRSTSRGCLSRKKWVREKGPAGFRLLLFSRNQ